MKSLLRYVFAALLATTFYYYSNGTEIMTSQIDPADEFEITDPSHPNYEGMVDQSEILRLCPGNLRECARNTLDNSIVNWNGETNKF